MAVNDSSDFQITVGVSGNTQSVVESDLQKIFDKINSSNNKPEVVISLAEEESIEKINKQIETISKGINLKDLSIGIDFDKIASNSKPVKINVDKDDLTAKINDVLNSVKGIKSAALNIEKPVANTNAIDEAVRKTSVLQTNIAKAYASWSDLVGNKKISSANAEKYLQKINDAYAGMWNWSNKLNNADSAYFAKAKKSVINTDEFKQAATDIKSYQTSLNEYSEGLMRSLQNASGSSRTLLKNIMPVSYDIDTSKTTAAIEKEKNVIDEATKIAKEHSPAIDLAAQAENKKTEASKNVKDAVEKEKKSLEDSTKAAKDHTAATNKDAEASRDFILQDRQITASTNKQSDVERIVRESVSRDLTDKGYVLQGITSNINYDATQTGISDDERSVISMTGSLKYYNEELKTTITRQYQAVKSSKDAEDANYDLALSSDRISRSLKVASKSSTKQPNNLYQSLAQSSIDKQIATLKNYALWDDKTKSVTYNSASQDTAGLKAAFDQLDSSVVRTKEDYRDFGIKLSTLKNRISEIQAAAKGKNSLDPLSSYKTKVGNVSENIKGTYQLKFDDSTTKYSQIINKNAELTASYESIKKKLVEVDSVFNKGIDSNGNNYSTKQRITYVKELGDEYDRFRIQLNSVYKAEAELRNDVKSFNLKEISKSFGDDFKNTNVFTAYSKSISALGRDGRDAAAAFNGVQSSYYAVKDAVLDYNNAEESGAKNLDNKKVEIVALTKEYNKYVAQLKETYTAANKSTSQSNKFTKDTADIRSMVTQLENYLNVNDRIRGNASLSQSFADLKSNMQEVIRVGVQDKAQKESLRLEYQRLKNDAENLGLTGQKWTTRIASQLQKLGVYLTGNMVFQQLRQLINNVVSTVTTLDSKLTDLQIATGKTRAETRELLNSYSELGKELSATTVDVAESADGWLRQGHSIQDANTLTKNSIMLAKLGQIDTSEATNALTSSMKGYGVAVDDVEKIVDKLTATDMSAAVSAGYIATAMAETANSANIAGVSMNDLIGYIAEVGQVTQDKTLLIA